MYKKCNTCTSFKNTYIIFIESAPPPKKNTFETISNQLLLQCKYYHHLYQN